MSGKNYRVQSVTCTKCRNKGNPEKKGGPTLAKEGGNRERGKGPKERRGSYRRLA